MSPIFVTGAALAREAVAARVAAAAKVLNVAVISLSDVMALVASFPSGVEERLAAHKWPPLIGINMPHSKAMTAPMTHFDLWTGAPKAE
jgi:hypothetical protein